MEKLSLLFLLFSFLFVVNANVRFHRWGDEEIKQEILNKKIVDADLDEAEQKWNYVNVRPNAYMFWWIYYTTAKETYKGKPLVMWLQGGPGGSSTGFGNFKEIGPLDVSLKPRATTWLSEVSLLFVDNPVGTGYSYVTKDDAFTKDVSMIAKDLVTTFTAFLKQIPDFQKIPFFIFSESYGGKMTAAFSQALNQAIKSGHIQCNFKGFAMGDSWISPIDSVLTWGPYLHSTSLVDKEGLAAINKTAEQCKAALDQGKFNEATQLWGATENVVESQTNGVNFYNILKWDSGDSKAVGGSYIDKLYQRHVAYLQNDALSKLMNGPIRKKLKIIPKNVTWGGQSGKVFSYQSTDFMKPVISIVDNMVTNTSLKVVVYSAQLDLICDTPGTEIWLQKLTWPGLAGYNNARRRPITNKQTGETLAFSKMYKNFSFYWILKAGHMVPADAGQTALMMLKMITS